MARTVVIFGTNSLAQIVAYYLQEEGATVYYTLHQSYCQSEQVGAIPLLPFESLSTCAQLRQLDWQILPALGYGKMNKTRQEITRLCQSLGYELTSYFHPSVQLAGTEYGAATIMLEGVSVSPFTRLGTGNIFWNGCNISHDCSIGSYNYFAPGVTLAGKITVGDNCFLGTGAIVIAASRLADQTLLGAAALLNFDSQVGQVILPGARSRVDESRVSTDIF